MQPDAPSKSVLLNEVDVTNELSVMQYSAEMLYFPGSINVMIGHEGNAAKAYFTVLAKLVPENFRFSGRSTHPPKDAFNSMLSLGYSIFYKHIAALLSDMDLIHILDSCTKIRRTYVASFRFD